MSSRPGIPVDTRAVVCGVPFGESLILYPYANPLARPSARARISLQLHGLEEAAAVPVFDANIKGRVEGIGCDPLRERLLRRFRLASTGRSSESGSIHGRGGRKYICACLAGS